LSGKKGKRLYETYIDVFSVVLIIFNTLEGFVELHKVLSELFYKACQPKVWVRVSTDLVLAVPELNKNRSLPLGPFGTALVVVRGRGVIMGRRQQYKYIPHNPSKLLAFW
jgi:hypothetical protein